MQAMTRSPQPNVMLRGLDFLYQMQRDNPAAFNAAFDERTAKTLAYYANNKGYYPPQQLAEKIAERSDPEWQKRKAPLVEQATQKANKDYDAAKVAGLFKASGALSYFRSGPGVPPVSGDAEALRRGFVSLYADAFADTGDEVLAQKMAFQLLQRKWGPSILNGGAITEYGPEKFPQHYPTIDGSHEWLKTALEDKLKALDYTQDKKEPLTNKVTTVVRPYAIHLLPGLTDAQIDAGVRPQYAVLIFNPENGEYDFAREKDGTTLHWPPENEIQAILQERMKKDRERTLKEPAQQKEIQKDLTKQMLEPHFQQQEPIIPSLETITPQSETLQ